MRIVSAAWLITTAIVIAAPAQNAEATNPNLNLGIIGKETLRFGNTVCAQNSQGVTTCCTTSGNTAYCKSERRASGQKLGVHPVIGVIKR